VFGATCFKGRHIAQGGLEPYVAQAGQGFDTGAQQFTFFDGLAQFASP
jgi:hypothetical protein